MVWESSIKNLLPRSLGGLCLNLMYLCSFESLEPAYYPEKEKVQEKQNFFESQPKS